MRYTISIDSKCLKKESVTFITHTIEYDNGMVLGDLDPWTINKAVSKEQIDIAFMDLMNKLRKEE